MIRPNSYRIFCDEIGNTSVPDTNKYTSQAPELFTQPMIVPAQAVEGRNRPQGDRAAGFLRENARTLNEPVNRVNTRNVSDQMEKRWWEWNLPVENPNLKKRSLSSSNLNTNNKQDVDIPGFQTTYQKDHGYLRTAPAPAVRIGSVNENQGGAARHTYNPNNAHAVGIIPINDLNNYSKNVSGEQPGQQRVFADKMSFEHNYDSRKDANYPVRGKRQGAYVIEQIEPKPALGLRTHVDRNKGASVWDAMHLDESPVTRLPPTAPMARHSALTNEQYRNQRRDPIGYYEDPKFGAPKPDSLPAPLPASAPVAMHPNHNQQQQQQQSQQHEMSNLPDDISYQTKALAYNPTWSNVNADFQLQRLKQTQQQLMNEVQSFQQPNGANDLLDQAMMYQRPMINGH